MRTLQRLRDVAIGYCLSNRRSLIALTALLMSLPLGLLSPAAVAIGGMVLGLGQYSNILTVQTAAGTLFNTYTTAKSVINATNLVQLPPNYLYVGKKLRVTVRGAVSNIVTTPGTITFQIMMGSIVAWSSGAIQLNATAHTTLPFTLVVDLRCDTIGAATAAKFMGLGQLSGIMFTITAGQVDGVNSETVLQVPRTAPAVGTGFDSTIANILDFWTGFSISNAGNGIQVQDYTVEELN
jgi:hypothetical protein